MSNVYEMKWYEVLLIELKRIKWESMVIISYQVFSLKIRALARIWTRDLPGTKPICYQMSYPGLNQKKLLNWFWKLCYKTCVPQVKRNKGRESESEGMQNLKAKLGEWGVVGH